MDVVKDCHQIFVVVFCGGVFEVLFWWYFCGGLFK